MILTCPQCETKFKIDQKILVPAGKTVRCSSCKHKWFQPVEGDEIRDVEDSKVPISERDKNDDIPDGVKPRPEDDEDKLAKNKDLKNESKPPKEKVPTKALAGSVAAATVLFLFIAIIVILFRSSLATSMPGSRVVFDALGLEYTLPGEGLAFDQLRLEKNESAVGITGFILNLTSEELIVPNMTVTISDKDGKVLRTWKVAPPQRMIEPDGKMQFTAEFEGHFEAAESADIRF